MQSYFCFLTAYGDINTVNTQTTHKQIDTETHIHKQTDALNNHS